MMQVELVNSETRNGRKSNQFCL